MTTVHTPSSAFSKIELRLPPLRESNTLPATSLQKFSQSHERQPLHLSQLKTENTKKKKKGQKDNPHTHHCSKMSRAQLPKERFHSTLSYYFDRCLHSPGSIAIFAVVVILFALAANIQNPDDPSDYSVNIILAIFGVVGLILVPVPGCSNYYIPDTLPTAGQLKLYNAIIREAPTPDPASWDGIAREVNEYVLLHNCTRTG